ncbi:hypothetical protein [Streptomyces sp. NPDC059611]|uniref:hypothetical protein n=1 Tax=Streptomyces sp. NPDC059611 TaxID=3346884 RepID=UPI0036C47C05
MIYAWYGDKDGLFNSVLEHHVPPSQEAVTLDAEDLPGHARRVFDFHRSDTDLVRLLMWQHLERPAASPTRLRRYSGRPATRSGPSSAHRPSARSATGSPRDIPSTRSPRSPWATSPVTRTAGRTRHVRPWRRPSATPGVPGTERGRRLLASGCTP